MYFLAEIDGGGFIYANFPHHMVHRESQFPWMGMQTFEDLAEAKEELLEKSIRGCPTLIVKYNAGGSVGELWTFACNEAIVKERLRIWNGCYGTWPVRRLSESVSQRG